MDTTTSNALPNAMPNVTYTIADTTTTPPEPFDIKMYEVDMYKDDEESFSFSYDELYMLYMSYSVRSLSQILNYYGINKKKLVKNEMIQVLLFFELDINNADVVLKRWRLWKNIEELSLDAYFKQFILFTI